MKDAMNDFLEQQRILRLPVRDRFETYRQLARLEHRRDYLGQKAHIYLEALALNDYRRVAFTRKKINKEFTGRKRGR